jgi:hypothetical protein
MSSGSTGPDTTDGRFGLAGVCRCASVQKDCSASLMIAAGTVESEATSESPLLHITVKTHDCKFPPVDMARAVPTAIGKATVDASAC